MLRLLRTRRRKIENVCNENKKQFRIGKSLEILGFFLFDFQIKSKGGSETNHGFLVINRFGCGYTSNIRNFRFKIKTKIIFVFQEDLLDSSWTKRDWPEDFSIANLRITMSEKGKKETADKYTNKEYIELLVHINLISTISNKVIHETLICFTLQIMKRGKYIQGISSCSCLTRIKNMPFIKHTFNCEIQ